MCVQRKQSRCARCGSDAQWWDERAHSSTQRLIGILCKFRTQPSRKVIKCPLGLAVVSGGMILCASRARLLARKCIPVGGTERRLFLLHHIPTFPGSFRARSGQRFQTTKANDSRAEEARKSRQVKSGRASCTAHDFRSKYKFTSTCSNSLSIGVKLPKRGVLTILEYTPLRLRTTRST